MHSAELLGKRREKERRWIKFSNEKWKIGIWFLFTAFVAVNILVVVIVVATASVENCTPHLSPDTQQDAVLLV